MERPFDFVDFVELIWAGRVKIMVAIVITCSVAVLADVLMAPRYKATELLEIRVPHQRLSGLSGLARSLGGLAGLAGASLNGSGNERSVALATLKSRYIIEHFIEKHDLLPVLFANKWDKKSQRWEPMARSKIPTNQDGYKYFTKKLFSVQDDGTTGLVRVVIQWRNPSDAAAWLTDIVTEANARLRKREVNRFKADISYLGKTAESVVVVPVKQSLYSLMAIEYRKLMVAENPEDAPLEVVDPVVVPRRPEPRLLLLLLLGGVGGFVLGLLYVVLTNALGARRERRGAGERRSMSSGKRPVADAKEAIDA